MRLELPSAAARLSDPGLYLASHQDQLVIFADVRDSGPIAGPGRTPYFYRTAAGAEIDLLLDLRPAGLWAFEIKRALNPHPGKGFHLARPPRRFPAASHSPDPAARAMSRIRASLRVSR